MWLCSNQRSSPTKGPGFRVLNFIFVLIAGLHPRLKIGAFSQRTCEIRNENPLVRTFFMKNSKKNPLDTIRTIMAKGTPKKANSHKTIYFLISLISLIFIFISSTSGNEFYKKKYSVKRPEFRLQRWKKRVPVPKMIPLTALPRDKYNMVDWAAAGMQGLLDPRPSLKDDFRGEKRLDLDVILKSKRRFMPNVLFPHDIHTYWLSCRICHPNIFIPKQGGNPGITMWAITKGKFCGRCHDRVAFPIRECYRCHMDRIPENFPKIEKQRDLVE